MGQNYIYGGIAALVFGFLIFQSIRSAKLLKARRLARIREEYGKYSNGEYEYDDFQSISHYHRRKKQQSDRFTIDDITWNDLDMDNVFLAMNNTQSSVGQDYLYDLLRTPCFDEKVLEERSRLAEFFAEHTETRENCQLALTDVGYTRKISLMDYVDGIRDLKAESNWKHFFCILAFVVSFAIIPFSAEIGVMLMIGTLIYNVATYLSAKGRVESYFMCISAIVRLIKCGEDLMKFSDEELSDYTGKLRNAVKTIQSVKRDAAMLGPTDKIDGGLMQAMLDYVRMIFHVDLICYNNALKKIQPHMEDVITIWETIGELETGIAIASFRKALAMYAKPEFAEANRMQIRNGYHPLIAKPVANTIEAYRPVLITGSNASGKSTFLKMVAINAILAQTVHTVLAEQYTAPMYRVYSSMALRDDLSSNESYYMVEIRSLKRIMDAGREKDSRVLCFVDEVLRGTNTVERIAASAKVLQRLSKDGVMCFAATHDIELTQLLEKEYENYHFTEEIEDGDIRFSYRIYKGRATSRNAIKLLGMMGYEESVIADAEATAKRFLETGEWSMEA